MISGVAFVPSAPVLVSQLAAGAAPELAELRSLACEAIARVSRLGDRVALVGSASRSACFGPQARGSFGGYGLDLHVALDPACATGQSTLPLELCVGAWLCQLAGVPINAGFAIGPESVAVDARLQAWCAGGGVLVVVGDGSARRSTSAPGYFDQRAAGFDASVAAALASGEPAQLTGFDQAAATGLLAAGPPAWATVGRALAGLRYDALLDYDQAPYGVGYFVARWLHGRLR